MISPVQERNAVKGEGDVELEDTSVGDGGKGATNVSPLAA
jgi:hypothetical protein